MQRRSIAWAVTVLALLGTARHGLAVPAGGKLIKVTPEAVAENRPFKITVASVGSYVLPAPGAGPDVNGATLRLIDLGPSPATDVTIDLPAALWSRRQSNTSLKYLYHGMSGLHPCTGVVAGPTRWKVRCRGFTNVGAVTGTVGTPFTGTARVQLLFGGGPLSLCQEFGGITTKNDATALARFKAPPTGTCSPAGAFVDGELP